MIFIFKIDPEEEIEEVEKWCQENISEKGIGWSLLLPINTEKNQTGIFCLDYEEYVFEFFIIDVEDAAAFKLRWL